MTKIGLEIHCQLTNLKSKLFCSCKANYREFEINEAFKKFDFLIAPTVPILPFKVGEKINDPVALFLVDINTVTANLTGKPAISIPFAISNGLPIGMQLFADSMQDKSLLQAAYALEQTVKLPEVPI